MSVIKSVTVKQASQLGSILYMLHKLSLARIEKIISVHNYRIKITVKSTNRCMLPSFKRCVTFMPGEGGGGVVMDYTRMLRLKGEPFSG